MKQVMEDGVTEVLSSVVEDISEAVNKNISGAHVLHELLSAPWLHALLKIYECLIQFQKTTPSPFVPYASGLSYEISTLIQRVPHPSAEARELYGLLSSPHIQALLSSHDSVAQADYLPVLPPLPDELPEDEEAMRIVCLVKNNQPLGATIKRDEETGEIYIARVIHGGLADRSGLLHPGDLIVEVNGDPVVGMEPERVIQILARSKGTILFKVIPNSAQISNSQKPVYMRAMVDYSPQQDPSIPCPDAGMSFLRGDLLEVVDQSDAQWWQARKLPCGASFARLIPSASTLKSKQREHWWCQPLQTHTCIPPLASAENDDDPTLANDKCITTELETSKDIKTDDTDSDFTDGIYLAGFRRSFHVWKKTSFRRRRQSCTSCTPNGGALATPYEEVVLYQRPPQENHRLIMLVGASGVGVSELRKRLIKLNPSTFQGPVPHTTRPMREGEQMGREYHFVTKEIFESMILHHRFVEYGENKGHLYGTSIDAIDEVLKRGRMCIIDAEPQSILLLRIKTLKPFVIFIKPPNLERLRHIRRNPGASNYNINSAFTENDFQELEEVSQLIEAKYRQFFDRILVNDGLQDACVKLSVMIQQAQNEPQWIPVSWLRAEE